MNFNSAQSGGKKTTLSDKFRALTTRNSSQDHEVLLRTLQLQCARIADLEQRLCQAAALSKTSADRATLLEVDQTGVNKTQADQVVQQASVFQSPDQW